MLNDFKKETKSSSLSIAKLTNNILADTLASPVAVVANISISVFPPSKLANVSLATVTNDCEFKIPNGSPDPVPRMIASSILNPNSSANASLITASSAVASCSNSSVA